MKKKKRIRIKWNRVIIALFILVSIVFIPIKLFFKNTTECKEEVYMTNFVNKSLGDLKTYALENNLGWYDVKFDWDGTITKKFANHLIEQGYNLDDLLENDDKYEICGHTNPGNKK